MTTTSEALAHLTSEVSIDAEGLMRGATGHYRRSLADLDGLYADADAFAAAISATGDAVAYEVYEHRVTEDEGDLIFGTSLVAPFSVGDEFSMTRGHIHMRSDRTEIYHCLRGHGVMLMETREGEVLTEEMVPGRVVYVPAHHIHRSVNVGQDLLVTLFCYGADAGQDYEIISDAGGMRSLVVDDGRGGWELRDNPGYRPRTLST